jgi:signal peptidase I
VVVAISAFIVFRFVLVPVRVEGESMWPTYRNRRVNLINRWAYLWHEPRRFDVVGFRLQAGPHVMLLKRVVGLPGETVEFRDGHLYIDGRRLNEPYVRTRCRWNEPPEIVRADEYYVVGDNRAMPAQNHEHGGAERRRIIGKVLL